MATTVAMKTGDVFRFRYNAEAMKKISDPNHCFDGQLVFKDGVLFDTYWGFEFRGEAGRRFLPAEAEQKGSLTFVCNLDDVERVAEHLWPQFDESDRFNLSHQHGCYKLFVIRKGAKKSLSGRLAILDARVKLAKDDAERAMRYAFNEIQRAGELRARLNDGEDVTV